MLNVSSRNTHLDRQPCLLILPLPQPLLPLPFQCLAPFSFFSVVSSCIKRQCCEKSCCSYSAAFYFLSFMFEQLDVVLKLPFNSFPHVLCFTGCSVFGFHRGLPENLSQRLGQSFLTMEPNYLLFHSQ